MPSTVHQKRVQHLQSGTVPIAVAPPMTRARAKKAGLLGMIWSERLASAEDTLRATRVVLEMDPDDPRAQANLAMSLLRAADILAVGPRAAHRRREAADILCKSAARAPDDRALEAIEQALAAVPDHAAALALLEEIAPRVGRADSLQAHWLAGLKKAPRGPLARQLRLKLAATYLMAGAIEEARSCLRVLVRKRDPEAIALMSTLKRNPVRRRQSPLPEGGDKIRKGINKISEDRDKISEGSDKSQEDEAENSGVRECAPKELPVPVPSVDAAPVVAVQEVAESPSRPRSVSEAKSDAPKAPGTPRIEERLLASLREGLASACGAKHRLPLLLGIADLRAGLVPDRDEELEAYSEALSLAPADSKLFERARRAYEREGRGAELAKRVMEIRESNEDPGVRTQLLRRAVVVQLTEKEDVDATIAAYRELLSEANEVDTRRSLVRLLEHRPTRAAELAVELDRLAQQVAPEEAKTLRLKRASLLRHTLSAPLAAVNELERIVDEIAPDDVRVLELLATVAEEAFDLRRVASAKRRQLALLEDQRERAALAEELTGLYQDELDDEDGAIFALTAWTQAAPTDRRPYLRLLPLLERNENYEELVHALEALAALTVVDEDASEFLIHASLIESRLIGQHERAWQRLVPRVVERLDLGADKLLREIAEVSGRRRDLAELFVQAAMRATDPFLRMRRWVDAAREFEELNLGERALEAALRALACDMNNVTILDDVDRLAVSVGAWDRLVQVYDVLARRAETTEAKIKVLMREARLLEREAKDLGAARARLVAAAQLDPTHEDAHAEATRLATLTAQYDWVSLLRELRGAAIANRQQDLEALLNSCAVCVREPAHIPGVMLDLASAVRRAGDDELVLTSIEQGVKKLDAEQPMQAALSLTLLLTEAFRRCAAQPNTDPRSALLWLLRASELYEHSLGDDSSAFEVMQEAAKLAPSDEMVLDKFTEAARRTNRMDELVEHFRRAADRAMDGKTAVASLARLGPLLEHVKANPDEAADVYQRLVMLQPLDLIAADRLRVCLKSCGRFNELLAAIEGQLALVNDYQQQISLLEEAADIWETHFSNRSEALETWRRVGLLKPFDATVEAAIERLQKKPALDESVLLSGDVVVLPEDLIPSVPPPAPETEIEPPLCQGSDFEPLREGTGYVEPQEEWPLVAAFEILEGSVAEEVLNSPSAAQAIFV